jgi:putative spermidine/putrescine transport system permease protein
VLVPVIVLGLGLYLNFAWLGLVGSTASLVIAHTVLVVPFIVVSVSSGLRQIDPALESVALLMGASRARVMRSVVLPQIRPAIAVGALFAFLISFDEVVVAYFLAGPTTMTLPVKMYSAIRWEISPVLAAISTLLTAASLLVCVVMLVLQKPEQTR